MSDNKEYLTMLKDETEKFIENFYKGEDREPTEDEVAEFRYSFSQDFNLDCYCPMCDLLNEPMQVLNNTIHYNCRNCGQWWSM